MSQLTNRSISAAFVQAVVKRAGIPAQQRDAVLTSLNIPLTVLQSERSRVSISQFAQLIARITSLTKDHSLGYYQQRAKPGIFLTMARYCGEADHLLQAIHRNIEFFNLFDTGFTLTLHERDRYAFYRMEPDKGLELETWLCEEHLMVSHRFFCWLVGTPFPLLRVNLGYPPPSHREEYHYLFRCEHRFNQPHFEFVFERHNLKLPIIRSKNDLEDYLSRIPYEFMQMPEQESSFSEQIRRYLKRALPAIPSYEQIAASLSLTPQTLRRRLAQEGCDYRQLKNEFLRDTAISLLQDADGDVKAISYQLGFSEPSAFIRSFKKWTGSTPNSYRQGLSSNVAINSAMLNR